MTHETAAAEAHADRAAMLEILEAQAGLELALAKFVHEVRGKKLEGKPWWFYLGFETEKEFAGATITAGGLNTRLNQLVVLDRCYRIFVIELGLTPAQVMRVGFGKLDILRGILKREPESIDEWLLRAEELSVADLIAEKKRHLGHEDRGPKPKAAPVAPEIPGLDMLDPDTIQRGDAIWQALARETACIIHPDKLPFSSDRAHIDRTKGAGGMVVIPLCRACHQEQEGRTDEWIMENRVAVTRFAHRVVCAALARASELQERTEHLSRKLREIEEQDNTGDALCRQGPGEFPSVMVDSEDDPLA